MIIIILNIPQGRLDKHGAIEYQSINYDVNTKFKVLRILRDFLNSNQKSAYVSDYDLEYISASSCIVGFLSTIRNRNLPVSVKQSVNLVYLFRTDTDNATPYDTALHTFSWLLFFEDFLADNQKIAQIPNTSQYATINNAQSICNRQIKKYNLPLIAIRENNMLFISRR